METRRRVLVVDDDPDIIESLRNVLELNDFEVLTASKSDEAIDLAKRERPDLVILDLMIEHPDSGFGIAHHIKTAPECGNPPILMLTNVTHAHNLRFSVDSEEERQWIKVDGYLTKPVRSELLIGRVRQLLS